MADGFLRYIVGHVEDVLDSLPEASVDLILTSSPFLSVRSYLPPNDPLKSYEMGSERTPGAFIDNLLNVVQRCRRVLAPHGSLVWELGDASAGAGGAGGDYNANGLREGQPKFEGSARKARQVNDWPMSGAGSCRDRRRDEALGIIPPDGRLANYSDGRGRPDGMRDTTFSGANTRTGGGAGWPLDKSLSMVPELFRLSLAYGFNPLTGRETERWRVRNVVRHFRPNPPVGSLSDSFRAATSDWVVACTGQRRYFDLDAARQESSPNTHKRLAKGAQPRHDLPSQQRQGNWDTLAVSDEANPAGAPPLDWWDDEVDEDMSAMWPDAAGFVQPARGYRGAHYAVFSQTVVLRFLETMCPRQVCLECGKPSERVVVSGYASAPDDRTRQRKATEHRLNAYDYPPEDGWERERGTVGWSSCACGGATPTTWDLATLKEWRAAGKPAEWRSVLVGCRRVGFLNPSAGHWVECGGPITSWRRGVVLDPFVGTATTLAVAHGHSRDSIGIDLDIRNVDLARERCGFFLTVEDQRPAPPAVVVPVDFTKAETGHVTNVDTGGLL